MQDMGFRLAPGTGDAGFGIGDQIRGIHAAGFKQGQKPELHGSRIAARIGDHPCPADLVAIDFRQCIDCFGDEFRAGMLHLVPLFPQRDVPDAEVGSKIDDAHTSINQRTRLLHRNAVGRGKEHQVTVLEAGGCRLAEFEVDMAAQAGKHLRHCHPGFLA